MLDAAALLSLPATQISCHVSSSISLCFTACTPSLPFLSTAISVVTQLLNKILHAFRFGFRPAL